MSVNKTARALIKVLDAAGKVSNYEIEFMKTYVGDDPDIAKGFIPQHVREEVTAEVFESYDADAGIASAESARALDAELATAKEQLLTAEVEYNKVVAQRNELAAKLDSLLKGVAEQLVPFAKPQV